MTLIPPRSRPVVAIPPALSRLNSWKEIAAYLDTSVRTVQRWEKEEGLPVHRHEHLSHASVHAFSNEIDGWMEQRRKSNPRDVPVSGGKTRARIVWAGIATAVLLLAVLAAWTWRSRIATRAKENPTIAVLYFTNLSRDPALDWLNRGLCELLTTNLAQIRGMDVLSTERIAAVVQRVRQKEINAAVAPEVARNAGASAFITGTYLRTDSGGLHIALRAQDSADGRILLSESAEGENTDAVFRLVNVLTERVTRALLSQGESNGRTPAVEAVLTPDVEAYRHYQLARDAHLKFDRQLALRELEEVVHRDPAFGLAWLEIASVHTRFGPKRTGYEILRDLEVNRARLPRRSQLAVPIYRAWAGDDFTSVRRGAEALLAEFPRDVEARIRISACHIRFGRFEEAAEAMQEGVRLDPNNPYQWNQYSYCLAGAGKLDAALKANDRCRELMPENDPHPWLCRGELLFLSGRLEESITALRKSLELGWYQDGGALMVLASAYAEQQKFGPAEEALREYLHRSKDTLRPFYEGQFEEARGRLEAAQEIYRQTVESQARANPDSAGSALMAFAHIAEATGKTAEALTFATGQRLNGEEHLAISYLEAAQGDLEGAERSLQRYGAACPWVTPAAIEFWRVRNQMVAAVTRNDWLAVQRMTNPLPILRECWIPVYEARAALMQRDYATAEKLLRRTIFLQRMLVAVAGLSGTRSPLVSLLCHFHLGQVYEATGNREAARAEYEVFLKPFQERAASLPQIAEARTALQRLGARR